MTKKELIDLLKDVSDDEKIYFQCDNLEGELDEDYILINDYGVTIQIFSY